VQLDASSSTVNLGMGDVTIGSGAGAFTLGSGGTTIPSVVFRDPTASLTNNSTNPATLKSNVLFKNGGGVGNRNVTFDGSGNWVVEGSLLSSASTAFGTSAATAILTKSGTGALTLGGANNHGSTAINGGTLAISGTGTLGLNTVALTLGGGALDLGGTSQTVGAVTISAGASSGDTIKNGSLTCTTLSVGGGTATVSANLTGTGNVTVAATATLNIAGSYSGGGHLVWSGYNSTINLTSTAGDVVVGAITSTGSSSRKLNLNGGVLKLGSDNSAATAAVIGMNGGTIYNNKSGGSTLSLTANSASVSNTVGAIVIGASGGTFNTTGGSITLANGTSLAGNGVVTVTGGNTLTITGVSTHTGNTTVSSGTLDLADNAGAKFVIGASGTNNKITGAGTATLEGDFTFDLTNASKVVGDAWTIVDTASKSFTPTFTVVNFTDAGNDQWTQSIDASSAYQFTESTGVLSVVSVPEPASFAAVAGLAGLMVMRRRREQIA
jgi:autotransporter-associated beta strand protein